MWGLLDRVLHAGTPFHEKSIEMAFARAGGDGKDR